MKQYIKSSLSGFYYYYKITKKNDFFILEPYEEVPNDYERISFKDLLRKILEYNNFSIKYIDYIIERLNEEKIEDMLKDMLKEMKKESYMINCNSFSKKTFGTYKFLNKLYNFCCTPYSYNHEIVEYIILLNELSSEYYLLEELRNCYYEPMIITIMSELRSGGNICRYTNEFFKSFGLYYMVHKNCENFNEYACKYIYNYYNDYRLMYEISNSRNCTRTNLITQERVLIEQYNNICLLLEKGIPYDLICEFKIKSDLKDLFYNSCVDYSNTVNLKFLLKIKEHIDNEFNTDNFFGKMNKPNFLDDSKVIVYLYSQPNKDSQVKFIGRYRYIDNIFHCIEKDVYVDNEEYYICRLDRLVYYLLKNDLGLSSTDERLLRILKYRAFSYEYADIFLNKLLLEVKKQYANGYKDIEFEIINNDEYDEYKDAIEMIILNAPYHKTYDYTRLYGKESFVLYSKLKDKILYLGYFKYDNKKNIFYKCDINWTYYDYDNIKAYTLESFIYYILKSKFNIKFGCKPAIEDILKSVSFDCSKYMYSFSAEDLENDILNSQVLIKYKQEKKRIEEIKLYREKLSHLSGKLYEIEFQKMLELMTPEECKTEMNRKHTVSKNLSKQLALIEREQNKKCDYVPNNPFLKLDSKGESIKVNNHIKKITEIDNGYEVIYTYHFYDVNKDKNSFLRALSYALWNKSVDARLYKIVSLKRSKYYPNCLEIKLVGCHRN